ncbi:MAG: Na+/H+ antiporter subunit D, partial [Rhizobiaceae bacterium]|nr:Na+/H+ antiporter subunit D [Rhizobiaceae bacterium]
LIASFGLIVLGSERAQLDGATKYGFLNLIATTLFLVATGYLYGVFGTLNMADIAAKAAAGLGGTAVLPIAVMYLLAFGMKAAAFPLGAWLPASYHTPRFVVSALFAGLLTKVGVYALIRVLVMLFPPERATLAPVIAWVAALTMVLGAIGALAQSDIRRLLNHFVVAGIGTILAGLALPELVPEMASRPAAEALHIGLSGSILYALHSMVVMTGLYLAAEVMARRTGSSSLHGMGGLWRQAPALSALVLVLLLAVSGLPPFFGFWPKLALLRAALLAEMPWLAAAILVSGFLMTIASARVFALAVWRPLPARRDASGDVGMAPAVEGAAAAIPLAALLAFVVVAGLWPQPLAGLAAGAAEGILGSASANGSGLRGAP